MINLKQSFLGFVFLLFGSNAFCWGAKGHQIIASVGAELAKNGQAFWQANVSPIRTLSTVPDRVWKSTATKSEESPNHFFEIDTYYSASNFDHISDFPSSYTEAIQKYTEGRVVRDGTAPWRVRQLYRLALQALRQGNMKQALQDVGVLSHYVGDLSQPLHVSENYDGQMTGNQGIHQFFESSIIKDEKKIQADVKKRAEKILKKAIASQQFGSQLMDVLLQEVERSISMKEQILKNDDRYGRTSKGIAVQLELAKDRMADGAATFALILSRLWQDSGLVAHATPLTVQDPAWIQPDYKGLNFATKTLRMAHQEDEYIDCN